MHHRILRLKKYQLLEIKKRLTRVANEVGALSAEEVGVEQLVVKFDDLCEVSDRLFEHGEAGVAAAFVEEVGGVGLFFAGGGSFQFDYGVDVAECLVEVVEVVEDVASG